MSFQSSIRRVLVVEDNPSDAYLIKEAFAECGYKCELTFAESRDEAIPSLSAHLFDLLLSDFGIDHEAAQTFILSVRKVVPSMPIIVLSSIVDPTPAYMAGANAFVRKASDVEAFFRKIQVLMQFWMEVAELPTNRLAYYHLL